MEKVVTINLGGNPYQLDEPAYAALRAYLESAAHALRNNPDKDEIVADLESAIAQKADGYLGPGKSVVGEADMARILSEMGAIEDEGGEDGAAPAGDPKEDVASSAGASQSHGRRKLYRLPDGAMIAGVCNGLGAYFSLDPAIVRLLFIIAAIVTQGVAIIGYVVLMFVMPAPVTPEEWAKAHNAPFNAQEVIERAKEEYKTFAEQNNWYGYGGRRAARRARRAARRARRVAREVFYPPPPMMAQAMAAGVSGGVASNVARGVAGLIATIFGLVGVALLVLFIVTLVSLASTGAIFGWAPPGDLPTWALILIVVFAFFALSTPVRAMRRAARGVMYGRNYAMYGAFDGIVWLGLLALSAWLAYVYVPGTHIWFEQASLWAQQAWDSFVALFQR
jgi:phage shock protein PspC (stress-responsive transcriptional regulator)